MKKHLIAAVVSSVVLVAFAYLALILMPTVLPNLAEEYFNPAFVNEDSHNVLYFIQPVVLSFGLSWFWTRFKGSFKGGWFLKGIEMGLVYVFIASIPAMMLVYSAMNVSLAIVGSWILYGFAQATIAGEISARIDP